MDPRSHSGILDFRKQNGPFKRIEDLMKVKGIARRCSPAQGADHGLGKGTRRSGGKRPAGSPAGSAFERAQEFFMRRGGAAMADLVLEVGSEFSKGFSHRMVVEDGIESEIRNAPRSIRVIVPRTVPRTTLRIRPSRARAMAQTNRARLRSGGDAPTGRGLFGCFFSSVAPAGKPGRPDAGRPA